MENLEGNRISKPAKNKRGDLLFLVKMQKRVPRVEIWMIQYPFDVPSHEHIVKTSNWRIAEFRVLLCKVSVGSEKELNFSTTTMDGFLEKPLDNKEQSLSHDELMIRRLKNRERQRRYRARKRLQADMNKAPNSDSNQYTPQHAELPVNVAPEEFATPLNIKKVPEFPENQCSPVLLEVPVTVTQHYEMPLNAIAQECLRPVNNTCQVPVTRVHSSRDWKRDARKARALKQQEVRSEATPLPESTSSNGSQTSLPHSNEADMVRNDRIPLDVSAQVNNETPRFTPSRRHWKAEARNKKS